VKTTWLIILGLLAVGAAVLLLLPHVLPERATDEVPAVAESSPMDVEEASPEAEPVEESAEPEGDVDPATDVDDESETAEAPVVVAEYSIDGAIGTGEYPNSTVIAGVEVYWANDATYLRVGLIAPGTGYVSIGFDPVRQMEGANYIVGYVEDGVGYFRDDYGTEPTAHMADIDRGGVDNIVSSAGGEWTDRSILEFIIPLDSGDELDKPLAPGSTVTVLVAYHDLQDGFTARHSRRGTGEIALDPAP
jgi:hypothetical protein